MNKSIMGFMDTYNEINIIYSKKGKYIAKKFYLYTGEDLVEEDFTEPEFEEPEEPSEQEEPLEDPEENIEDEELE